MQFEKYFSKGNNHPYDSVKWVKRDSVITDAEGNIKFEMKDVEVPESWSQTATDIFASKYCRKSGVPDERGHEWSLKQVVDRIADTIADFGNINGYFDEENASVFKDDLKWLLINQYGAFNSPVWFNVGLWHKYKIRGTGQNWAYDFDADSDDKYYQPENQYKRPQVSACFIQSVEDDLMSIFELAKNEASIFKYGSGSGVNVSPLRGANEQLSGGGKSSGLLSFLDVLDKAAGAIKSGGTTRRAAVLRALNVDHPEILDFIDWKIIEEEKAEALIKQGYDSDFNGEAYATISGQNSNNAVRLTDEFLKAVEEDKGWQTTNRTTGKVYETYKARHIFQKICEAAWRVADPGIQFDTTINNWNTCANSGRINSSNPCSEFMALDNTACNLASLNLVKFWKDGQFDVEAFRRAIRIFITAQDILVDLGSYPTKEIAKNSHEFRPLGLGYSNLGSLLMIAGYPYDSEEGRAMAGLITNIMTGSAYKVSAELAKQVGTFDKFEENKESMGGVLCSHYGASDTLSAKILWLDSISGKNINLNKNVMDIWNDSLDIHSKFRNSQVSLLAPTGCLIAGTLIATDKGLLPIEYFGKTNGNQWQDLHVTVAGEKYNDKKTTKFYINGIDEVKQIVTKNGYQITGTLKHQLKIFSNGKLIWKKISEIKEGDIIPVAHGRLIGNPVAVELDHVNLAKYNDKKVTLPSKMTSELAELLGFFMGNGSWHKKNIRFAVYGEDFDVMQRLKTLVSKIFNVDAVISDEKRYENMKYVVVNSVAIVRFFEQNGFKKTQPYIGHKGNSKIPFIPIKILMSNSEKIYAAFLRGLFESDGTITKTGIAWTSSKKTFHDEVKSLLLHLGMITKSDIGINGFGQNPQYRLRLQNQYYAQIFMDKVGFIGARKNNKHINKNCFEGKCDIIPISENMAFELLDIISDQKLRDEINRWKRDGKVNRQCLLRFINKNNALLTKITDSMLSYLLSIDCFYDIVETINDIDEVETYDISVPDGNTYIANGLISHNTIGLLMDCDTTGIEPAFSLIAHKKLAGGAYMKMVNKTVMDALLNLGYSEKAIGAHMDSIESDGHFENDVNFPKKHLPVFDCAMPSGDGKRFIQPEGHIKMLAAVQPFLSGAISKTINLPNSATVQDIWDIFMQSWKLGLKAVTVYRDGSKSSQPLTTEKDNKQSGLQWGESKQLPNERSGKTWEYKVGGEKVFLRSGEYEDGKPGEIFIDLGYKEGSTVRSLMDQFAISISYSLQHGAPLETLVSKFSYTKFEPHGLVTKHPFLKKATSIVDSVFRTLKGYYLKKDKPEIKKDKQPVVSLREEKSSSNMTPCSDCGGFDFMPTGNCEVCKTCGASQGCS